MIDAYKNPFVVGMDGGGTKTKVCVICPEHGEFYQAPRDHVRGNGCPQCANKRRGSKKRLTINEFIEKAREVHGDKYNYDAVKYDNINTKITIICPIHGNFEQIPMNHLLGQGCPKCIGRNLNTEDIIKRFREIHNSTYDYSKVEYKGMNKKVCIICPIHGEFWQTPSKHLLGQGCKKCSYNENGICYLRLHSKKQKHAQYHLPLLFRMISYLYILYYRNHKRQWNCHIR